MTASAALIAELEALNVALGEAEDRFLSSKPRVRAEVPIGPSATLVCGKERGEWGLYVATSAGSTLLLEASMRYRIEAALLLPDLERAFLAAGDERMRQVQRAIAAVQAWSKTSSLAALGDSGDTVPDDE